MTHFAQWQINGIRFVNNFKYSHQSEKVEKKFRVVGTSCYALGLWITSQGRFGNSWLRED